MFKNIFKKKYKTLSVIAILAVSLFGLAIPAVKASQPRDYDNNSVIYGGAYSVSELRSDITNGTGKPHQSGTDLKRLFSHIGMGLEHLTESKLENGYVYKNGNVTVNGKVVATNVKSMGRNRTAHSVQVSGISYPIYWRPTSDSFVSGSIPAFVYMNYDGTMAFAVIKSCGNPVRGVGVRVRPTPKYDLQVRKFNDSNADRTRQTNEPMLANWQFRVTGTNFNRTVTTGSNGSVSLNDLNPGQYTITEIQQTGWTSTTGLTRRITLNSNQVVWFGNRLIPVRPSDTYSVRARKFEDLNGNRTREENEPWLEGWTIRLSGNNLNREFQTDDEGTVMFTNLPQGSYTITEVQQTGWTNTTPLSQTVAVPATNTLEGYVEFGNKRIPSVVTPSGEVETKGGPLPTSGPLDSVMGTFGGLGLASAGIYYRKGRKSLLAALKTVK